MEVKCLKCNNNLTETDLSDVYATSCGHLYHSECLVHWLKRFQTCPHCMERQSMQDVIKIYFGIADIPQKNSQELKKRLQCVSNELQEKSDNIKNLKEETKHLKTTKKELTEELNTLKKQLEVKRGAIQFNRMAIDYHARICKVKEKYETEAVQLRQRLNTLQSINEIINGAPSEIDDILLRSTLDQRGFTLCVDALATDLENCDNCNEKLDEELVSYQSDLIGMEEKLNSLKAKYSNLLQELQEDEEEDFGELSELRRSIYNLIQNSSLEYLLVIIPEFENSNETQITETISEASTHPSSPETSTSPEIYESKCSPPDLALQKKCKDLVKNACKNPMRYLTSGKVELLDSDDETKNQPVLKTEKQTSRLYGSSKLNSKLDNKKYKKLVKRKNLSAEAGAAAKKSKMPSYSVLDLLASAKKKKIGIPK